MSNQPLNNQILDMNNIFHQAQKQFKSGQISSSRNLFNQIYTSPLLANPNLVYQSLINLSTLELQSNNLSQALKHLKKAFQLNPYRYQGYYNAAIINFYLQKGGLKSQNSPIKCLNICLAILYLEIGVKKEDIKLINKSTSLWDKNIKAIIHRALLYQKQNKIKLAQNEFQKLTFQLEEGDHHIQRHHLLQIYAQKTLFYRRIHKQTSMQQNLSAYIRISKELPEKIIKTVDFIEGYRLKVPQDQITNDEAIGKMIIQAQQLIKQLSEISSTNLHVQSQPNLYAKIKYKQNFIINNSQNLNQNASQQNNPKHKISQSDAYKPNYNKQDQLLIQNEEQIQAATLNFSQNKSENPHQSYNNDSLQNPSLSINEDEDSAILNQKIEQLQRQIKESGGNVPQIRDLSRNSQEENYLEFEIQKTIMEINTKKHEEQTQKISPQTRQRKGKEYQNLQPYNNSHHEAQSEAISQNETQTKRDSVISDDRLDTLTMLSKLSEAYELNLQQIKIFKSFKLEIRSVSMFDDKCPKKQAYLKAKYFNVQQTTQKCKDDTLTWNHTFDQKDIKHSEDQNNYQVQIEVHAKEGGWLSWHSDILLGTGTIKLIQKGETKCTLSNNQKKVGMLYYKLKLNKSQ